MKKIITIALVIFSFIQLKSSGQNACTVGTRKGLYVELFGTVFVNNPTYLANLENYILNNGYNYVLLYNMEEKVFSKSQTQTSALFPAAEAVLTTFISNLKGQNSNIQIGAVGGPTDGSGGLTYFFANVDNYNSRVAISSTDNSKCIDFNNLEDEYWGISGSANKYNEYVNHVQPALDELQSIAHPVSAGNYPHPQAEIYLGYFFDLTDFTNSISAQAQADEIDTKMDRLLLHLYIPNVYLQDSCVSGISNIDKLFLAYDKGPGNRLELLARNTKSTHIMPIFSAEASTIDPTPGNNGTTFNYYGDFLWFNGLSNSIHTGSIDDVIADFTINYNSNDPYYTACNGPPSVLNCTATISPMCSCTDSANQPTTGNIIEGAIWFKYGFLPFKNSDVPLYVSAGADHTVYSGSPALLTLNDNFNVINNLAQLEDCNSHAVTPLAATSYNWYQNGIYYVTSPTNSITVPSPAVSATDTWTCELVTNYICWSYMNHKLRDDINITGTPPVGSGDPYAIINQVINPTCPFYNNGSLTADVYYGTGNYSYLWSNGASTQTITGLVTGTYTVTIHGYFNNLPGTGICQMDLNENQNFPRLIITTGNPFSNCSPNLETQSFASYQWNFNGQPINSSSSTSQSYTAAIPGLYSVTVTNSSQCSGTSPAYNFDPLFSLSIIGNNSTCNTKYLGYSPVSVTTQWTVPAGVTYFQSGNEIIINWGTAYSTGGTITCTATNECGNTVTNSIQIIPFIVSASSTSSCPNINNGSSATTVTSGGASPFTYHWNSGTATTSSFMINLSSGTYVVTVTDHNSCSATASTIINNVPSNIPTPLLTGTTSASPGAHTYTITNYNSNYDNYYSWNVIANSGNATITFPNANKQTASINWPASGGRIEVSIGVQGCLQTTIYYVQAYCTNTYTYNDGSNQSSIINGNTVTRSNMTFNGLMEITSDFTFVNCGQVSFAPGAKILVHSGKKLTIDNCIFAPSSNCCKMWKGIELESGAMIVIKNNTYISEAEIGLLVNNNCVYTISDAHFRNNYIGMQIGTGASVDLTGSNIKSTEFYSNPYSCGGSTYSPFLPKYDGQSTTPGSTPLAGIKIKNCTYFKFGSTAIVSGGEVKFNNLSNGILANQSNVYISNVSFKNIIADGTYNSLLGGMNGCGAAVKNGYLSVKGLGGLYNSDNTVENCGIGFLLWGSNGEVTNVNTKNDSYIGCYLISTRNVRISGNTWQCRNTGIWTAHNPDAAITIDNNDFRMSNTIASYACIRNDEYSLFSSIGIKNNTMRLDLARYGIISTGMVNAEIKENTIQMNNNANKTGIKASNCKEGTYKCNTVYALQTYSNPQKGFEFSISNKNSVTCNWVNRQQTGVNFNGTCTDTRFEGNTFNDHNIGLTLEYAAQISPQYFAGNLWEGVYSSYGAYLSQIDQTAADANRFTYNSGSSSDNFPAVTNDVNGFYWFNGSQDQEDFSCAEFNCQPTIPREEQVQDDDQRIAEPDSSGDPIEETSNYMADKFLFEKLSDNPDFLQNNPILQAFYNQQLNGSIGLFSGLEAEISSAVRWETVYALVYSTNQTMIKNKTDSIFVLDSLLELSPGNSSIINQMEQLNNDVAALQASNDQVMQTIYQISDFRNTSALYGNSNLPTTEAYEYNETVINEIYLSTIAVGILTFTSSQESELINIMEQCPFTGGPAVWEARSLYSLIDNTMDWNDDAICTASGISPRIGKHKNTFVLYPNPTTGIVTLNYKLNPSETGSIEITNMLGVPVSFTQLNSDSRSIEIDLSSLKPAIYHYRIVTNKNQVQQGMIAIIR